MFLTDSVSGTGRPCGSRRRTESAVTLPGDTGRFMRTTSSASPGGTRSPRAGEVPVTSMNGVSSSLTAVRPASISRSPTGSTSIAASVLPPLSSTGWRRSETSTSTTPPWFAATNSTSPTRRRRCGSPGVLDISSLKAMRVMTDGAWGFVTSTNVRPNSAEARMATPSRTTTSVRLPSSSSVPSTTASAPAEEYTSSEPFGVAASGL
ncbi:hypothetical protein COSO111634_23470 [Corallococcus soli]